MAWRLKWVFLIFMVLAFTVSILMSDKRRMGRIERFLVDMPTISIDSVDSATLSNFKKLDGVALDLKKLSDYFEKQESGSGGLEIYSVSDSIENFLRDITKLKNDYGAMKIKYQGLITSVTYNSDNGNIMYTTNEHAHMIGSDTDTESSPFANAENQIADRSSRLYLPIWSYHRTDPGPLNIDEECMKTLTKWKDTDDFEAIKYLESETCLSRENKIKFVGMILINYLKIMQNNAFGLQDSCTAWDGLVSNISNPELKAVFKKINGVCRDHPVETGANSQGLSKECVTAFNDWAMDDVPLNETCTKEKNAFLSRIKRFLKIGESIPVEYLDSFYLVVSKLYEETKNLDFRNVLKSYAVGNTGGMPSVSNWKRAMDDLFRHLIQPLSIKMNGTIVSGAGLQDVGYKISNSLTDGQIVIECTFEKVYIFKSIITKSIDDAFMKKFSIMYADPFIPSKNKEMQTIMYGNDDETDVKINSLEDIVTRVIKIYPLEWGRSKGFRLGFEGFPVSVDKCSQTINVCEHDAIVQNDKAFSVRLQKQLTDEKAEKLRLLGKIDKLQSKLQSIASDSAKVKLSAPIRSVDQSCIKPVALPIVSSCRLPDGKK